MSLNSAFVIIGRSDYINHDSRTETNVESRVAISRQKTDLQRGSSTKLGTSFATAKNEDITAVLLHWQDPRNKFLAAHVETVTTGVVNGLSPAENGRSCSGNSILTSSQMTNGVDLKYLLHPSSKKPLTFSVTAKHEDTDDALPHWQEPSHMFHPAHVEMMASASIVDAVSSPASSVDSGDSIASSQTTNGILPTEPSTYQSLCFPLATSMDSVHLSSYQCLLREQIEVFETEKDDLTTKAQGRNTPIRLGQVGIRCRYCAPLKRSNKLKTGAVQFSMSINGIYKVALKMGRLHFHDCPMVPEEVKMRLAELQCLPRKRARGREYWKETLESQGVVEDSNRLRFISLTGPESDLRNEL
ncbi:MAG: hypothetical protein SGBAC_007167 [Bacillariaceae sp.]